MDDYHIRGGNRLYGSVKAMGSKNAALPVMAAAILAGEECFIAGCPDIADVFSMKYILKRLGCRIDEKEEGVLLDSSDLTEYEIPRWMMESMRSSLFLAGPLLARCGRVEFYYPGGCRIGERPIDLHLAVFAKLGAEIQCQDDKIVCISDKLKGSEINLKFPSVGATENAMCAAATAEGTTVIYGAAKEPEIVDLQAFLNSMGACVSGAGTNRIVIKGVSKLHGCEHRIISDRIESGTFLVAAAMTDGHIFVEGADPTHSQALISELCRAGCRIECSDAGIELEAPEKLKSLGFVSTGPYPEFPTDMQSQITAAMTIADGKTKICERIFESRFAAAKELNKMGASIEIYKRHVIIKGSPKNLKGMDLCAEDLRGGAALVLAALAADGESHISGIRHIKRGYFDFDKRLRMLGANIYCKDEDSRTENDRRS